MMKNIVTGIVAHVDAGKTTLCEAMLYLSGTIKKQGRVDNKDSFLDTFEQERARGITIFSKQAVFETENTHFTLVDTPGHVDFSAETERTMKILDYAVLVISGTDGVQAHTNTICELLAHYNVPYFIFVTKTDLPGFDRTHVLSDLNRLVGNVCVDFTDSGQILDEIALSSETAMEIFEEAGKFTDRDIAELIKRRMLVPVFFGSGLRTEGVAEFMDALDRYTVMPDYPEVFSARVFKISRDTAGNRLTHLKLTGGKLPVKALLSYRDDSGNEISEKVNQIRSFSGAKFTQEQEAQCGRVYAVTGLTSAYPGMIFGDGQTEDKPVLEPVMRYTIILPTKCDSRIMLPKLMELSSEDPQLHIEWDEQSGNISVGLMGRVQAEVFVQQVKDRFNTEIILSTGHIVYRETIANKVEGVGHFEPLRHYAEVHLIIEPGEPGSGIETSSSVPEDMLDRNWQRLILTHLNERKFYGVLTGSELTDVKITLAAGKAHIKHTEGGDFRQATYRAVRQGLMQAESVLLEPWYSYIITVPTENIGRTISDLRGMDAEFSTPDENMGSSTISGFAPVSAMGDYQEELMAYSHGLGRLSLGNGGYRPCANQNKIVESIGYSAENDVNNTADSVFCAHGAGINIKWDQVKQYMHLDSCLTESAVKLPQIPVRHAVSIDDRELEAIMNREFGPIRRPVYSTAVRNSAAQNFASIEHKKESIVIDGYNLIFAWDYLKKLSAESLDLARSRLIHIVSNYAGLRQSEAVIVFDAYRTPSKEGKKENIGNVLVVYTANGETGDRYIESFVDKIGKNYKVRVITSDNLIRLSALRSGVLRTSSAEFVSELDAAMTEIETMLNDMNKDAHKQKIEVHEKGDSNGK